MQITLTWQTLLTASAIVGAFVGIISYLRRLFGWFEKQKEQEDEIKAIQKEQSILVEGILACLKGLQEQGCDGAVTTAIGKIETHLNQKAHGG